MQAKPCAFCTLPIERVNDSKNYGVVIRDGLPISPGHTLIMPKRHIGSFFELETDERQDLLHLLEAAKKLLQEEFQPNGYNIGINDGPAAGQTVPHLHIHFITRKRLGFKTPAEVFHQSLKRVALRT